MNANDPNRKSWIEYNSNTDFPIQNIPFGIGKFEDGYRVCSRIGDDVIDLVALYELGLFSNISIQKSQLQNQYLNDFISLGKPITNSVRERIADILDVNDKLDAKKFRELFLINAETLEMSLPVKIGDYTDFYSSREHATNVGCMFRDPKNALLPNWLHIPVGYHGRSSSIIVSGKDVIRPKGQQQLSEGSMPVFGPCKQLDFELEMAFIVGKQNVLGTNIPIENAEEHIFGLSLFNDWSARDIQKWEYVPLGPFLSKNFASTISPWIITLEALDSFRVFGPNQDPEVLPYLKYQGAKNFDINLEVSIKPENSTEQVVSKSNFKYMYWNMAQQLAHHTINGCNMNVGDVCASGTISGPTPDSYGSMLEIAWKGTKPIAMKDGTTRSFIHDGDTVSLSGFAEKNGVRIGFGDCKAKILPAN
ncbi:MAG: fumarylacetoacetase [Saprospiraceae bacterium]|nr:fumarylacetoacetase [Saprospiraceae bacterium]